MSRVTSEPQKTKMKRLRSVGLIATNPFAIAGVASVIYLVWSIRLFPRFAHILNPDGVSYVDIARLYASSHFMEALNGYWGPLISWLAAPLLALGTSPLEAIKFVLMFAGVMIFFVNGWILQQLKVLWQLQLMVQIAIIPFMISITFGLITPDVLAAALLLLYFALVAAKVDGRLRWSVSAGFIAALGFFAKSIVLPIFLVHFAAYHVWLVYSRRLNYGASLRSFGAGLAVFLLCLAPWVGLLSYKYQHFTVSTTSSYNLALVGPHSIGHPMLSQGLLEPPPRAISAWTDPGLMSVRPWNPLLEGRLYLGNQVWINLNIVFTMLMTFSAVAVVLAALGIFVKTPGQKVRQYFGLSGILLALAYTPLVVEQRYLWATMMLAALLAASFLSALYRYRALGLVGVTVFVIILFSSIYQPPLGGLKTPVTGSERNTELAAQSLRDQYHVKGRVASSGEWDGTLYVLSYLAGDVQYLGAVSASQKTDQTAYELSYKKIEYFIAYGERALPYLGDYVELGSVSYLPGATLYQRKNSNSQ